MYQKFLRAISEHELREFYRDPEAPGAFLVQTQDGIIATDMYGLLREVIQCDREDLEIEAVSINLGAELIGAPLFNGRQVEIGLPNHREEAKPHTRPNLPLHIAPGDKSATVTEAWYQPDEKHLYVKLKKTGELYRYKNVRAQTWADMVKTFSDGRSVGSFYNFHIKGGAKSPKHSYEKVEMQDILDDMAEVLPDVPDGTIGEAEMASLQA